MIFNIAKIKRICISKTKLMKNKKYINEVTLVGFEHTSLQLAGQCGDHYTII